MYAALAVASARSDAAFAVAAAVVAVAESFARPAFSAARAVFAAANCAVREVTCAFRAVIVPLRSVTANVATADLTGAARPVTAVADEAPVTATVTVPATAGASFSALAPNVSVESAVTCAAVDVTIDFEIDKSAHVAPTRVAVTVSPPTALPNTSVMLTETDGIVFVEAQCISS